MSCTFVLGQAVGSISGRAIYILDNDGNNGTSRQGGSRGERKASSEKECSQG